MPLASIGLLTFGSLAFLGYSWSAYMALDAFHRPERALLLAALLAVTWIVAVLRPFAASLFILLVLPFYGNHPGGRLMDTLNVPLAAALTGFVWRRRHHPLSDPGSEFFSNGLNLAAGLTATSIVVAMVPALPAIAVRLWQINDPALAIAETLAAFESDPLYSISSALQALLAMTWGLALARALPDTGSALTVFRVVTLAFVGSVAAGVLDFHGVIDIRQSFQLPIDPRRPDSLGLQSFFWNPGWFAWWFVMAFGLALGLLVAEAPVRRLTLGAALGVCYGYFFTNPQRGGLVALHVMLGLLLVSILPRARSRALRIGLPAGGALVIAGVVAAFAFEIVPRTAVPALWRLVDNPAEAATSNLARANLWRVAVWMWTDAPLFGMGEASFGWLFREYAPVGSALDSPVTGDAHNTWLQILATRGLFGLAALTLLLIVTVRSLRTGLRDRDERRRAIALGLSLSLSGFLVYTVVQAMFYLQNLHALFWVMVAIAGRFWPVALPFRPTWRPRWVAAGLLLAIAVQLVWHRAFFDRTAALLAKEPRGFYPVSIGGPVGAPLRWSTSHGTLCLPARNMFYTMRFLVTDPRVGQSPRTITLSVAGREVDRFQADTTNVYTRTFYVSGEASQARVRPVNFGECTGAASEVRLAVEVDRTWSPLASGFGADSRFLGVAVFEPRASATDPRRRPGG
jgi:O-antigen ligase